MNTVLSKLWETDPETVKTIKEQARKIYALTKPLIKRKTLDLDKYDRIHVECLNLCLMWRDLYQLELFTTIESTNLEADPNAIIGRIYNLTFQEDSPQISEKLILVRIHQNVENLLKEIRISEVKEE